ncbi:hypothetical protein OEZ85_011816 [Tetradesmus obliquus]|uniref:Uncharacterized protein n=1 Tax=Tetradesmus obliquus TaxID=3088 RepID=A0ABY8TTW3_TETOB|nr:hypothetical protein OEZ85_011816 [Tetradesmus obliquus]
MPDLCLPLPKVGSSCGLAGQACCLVPAAGADPWNNIRASCSRGLTCLVRNIDSLPYGSSRHAQSMLDAAANSSLAAVLQSPHHMGACEQLPTALVAIPALVELAAGVQATRTTICKARAACRCRPAGAPTSPAAHPMHTAASSQPMPAS